MCSVLSAFDISACVRPSRGECGPTSVLMQDYGRATIHCDDPTLYGVVSRLVQLRSDGNQFFWFVSQLIATDIPVFLPYIHDIKEKILLNMHVYADDTIVYRDINSVDDCDILQQDHHIMSELSITCVMYFNICKYAIISITNKRSRSIYHYTIFRNAV